MSRKTTREFIRDAKNIHGEKYDYSLVCYENNKTPVPIICPIHGEFKKRPDMHIHRKEGCPPCANISMKEKLTKPAEQFILDAIEVHGDRYSYELVEYKGNKVKIKIICPNHGIFEQKPNNHLDGQGCPICVNRFTRTTEQFINDAQKIHGNKYDYSKSIYIDAHTKLIIKCQTHGNYEQTPNNHLNNHGCPKCAFQKNADSNLKSVEEFIYCAKKIHGDKYDYSLTEYEHSKIKTTIICKKHGKFLQNPNSHLQGQGCPTCRASKGESAIKQVLDQNNVTYTSQKKFSDCVDVRQLPFDFYIDNINMLIEFDGLQHEKAVSFFGGEEALADRIRKDAIKNQYAIDNGIGLIRITSIDQIDDILTPWIAIYHDMHPDFSTKLKYTYYNGKPLINDLE